MTTKERLFNKLKEKGIKYIDCNEEFVRQYIPEIVDMLFCKKITSSFFNIAIKKLLEIRVYL